MSIRLTKHQLVSLRKSVKRSKLVYSVKDGFTIPGKNTSRFLLIWVLGGSLDNIDQSNKCPICFFICCPDCDL